LDQGALAERNAAGGFAARRCSLLLGVELGIGGDRLGLRCGRRILGGRGRMDDAGSRLGVLGLPERGPQGHRKDQSRSGDTHVNSRQIGPVIAKDGSQPWDRGQAYPIATPPQAGSLAAGIAP
jgi:hypothetical protein